MRIKPLLCAALVVGLVLGVPSAASAMPYDAAGVVAPMADGPDFTPSGNKWRKYMINILSSVLGSATPRGWKAEQIANEFQYNFGAWEELNARLGIDGLRTDENGNIRGIKYVNRGQGTYTDVVIQQMEENYSKTARKGGTKGKRFAVPAFKPVPFKKVLAGAGGALAAYTAFEVATFLGAQGVNLVGGWFGYDSQGAVCSQTTDGSILAAAVRTLSGQDCSMWDFPPEYVANGDAGTTYGLLSYNGVTVEFLRAVTLSGGTFTYTTYCYKQTGTLQGTGLGFYARSVAGTNNIGYGARLPSVASTSHPCGELGLSYTNGPKSNGADAQATAASPAVYISSSNTAAAVASMSQSNGDPERYQDCKVTYTDGTSQTSQGERYRESSGGITPVVCPGTPSGKTPSRVQISDNQVGDSTKRQTVADEPVSPEYQDWWDDYPECRDGACKLDLFKKVSGAKFAVSCFDLEDGCADWFEQEDKESVYICRYGIHDVGLEECNAYAGLFQPGRVESGAAYVDPETGEWSGGQTSPKSGQAAFSSKIQDPAAVRNCDFSGLGFDPVAWVMKPVQCAMEWAFVPRPTVVEVSLNAARGTWDDKPPGVIVAAVESAAPLTGDSGCALNVTYHGVSAPLVNVCSGPLAQLPDITRILTAAVMAFMVFHLVRRQIAGMVGYNLGQG